MEGFSYLADRLHTPLALIAPDSTVVAANRPALSALGDDVVGTRLALRVREHEGFLRYLALAFRSTSPAPGAFTLIGPHASRWRFDASLFQPTSEACAAIALLALRPAPQAAARFISLNDQIDRLHAEIRRRAALESERARLLENERYARQQAEEAARLKDEFLASVSHELRTPLHAIRGWVSLLREQGFDPALTAKGLEVIDRNVTVQTKLVEDLIDLSRVATGRMRLRVQPVDIETIVRQAVESARPAAIAKQQRLELVADVGGCIVNGDPDRLLQIVWNLLSNATRYTPKGGRIQVVVACANSHVELRVSDTGQGIEESLLPFVFDRFRRGDGTHARPTGGLGLGLSIVRHLVELHGGLVFAESEGPGCGATFTVTLPLPLFESGRQERPPLEHSETAAQGGRLAGLRVLLAEDHEDSRELFAQTLSLQGATVVGVESSFKAQDAFRLSPPDLVISDIEMPGEDGFTLIRKLRAIETELGLAPVPAIAVTAHTFGDARVRALRFGYQAFLPKPVDSRELIELVASFCRAKLTGAS
jgi:signal transduction histidine kinase/ActR/RegA family two-component response regulator